MQKHTERRDIVYQYTDIKDSHSYNYRGTCYTNVYIQISRKLKMNKYRDNQSIGNQFHVTRYNSLSTSTARLKNLLKNVTQISISKVLNSDKKKCFFVVHSRVQLSYMYNFIIKVKLLKMIFSWGLDVGLIKPGPLRDRNMEQEPGADF